jgi:hypothetical protein
VTLAVTPQTHSSASTPTPYYYTSADIVVGDWISNATGGFAWIIRSIAANDGSNITCTVEDLNQVNTYADPTQTGSGGINQNESGFVFKLDESDQPILSPLVADVIISQWQTDLMGRFATTNPPVTTALKNYPTVTTANNPFVLAAQDGDLGWIAATLLGAPAIPPYTILANATATTAQPTAISVTGPLQLVGNTLSLGDQILDSGTF